MPLKSNFGIGNVVDPTARAQQSVAYAQDLLGQMVKEDMARKELANKRAQQARENQIAQERLGLARSAENRAKSQADYAMEQKRLLGDLLSGISTDTTTSKIVPARTESVLSNTEAIAKAQADKNMQEQIKEQQAVASDVFSKVYEPTYQRLKQAEEAKVLQGRKRLEDPNAVYTKPTNIPASSGSTAYVDKEGNKLSGTAYLDALWKDITGGTPTDVAKTYTPKTEAELRKQAGEEALRYAGITDKKGNTILPAYRNISVPKEQYKTISIPEKVETSKMDKKEWLTRELAKAKEQGLGGQAYEKYQSSLITLSDQLFGKNKPMTLSDQLSLLKYGQEQKTKAATRQDYESLYPSMVGKINTIDGWKAYEKKLGKQASSKFNIAEDLYKNMVGKDSGDVDAIYKFLSDNNDKLGKMSSDALKTLAAQLKAKYANESSADFSDVFGGSAAGDVFSDITLK
jgi:hypothetical protein